MSVPFKNEYNLKTVAEVSAKPCMVCLKPSTKVLITPDKKDFFYICLSHTEDRGFASAVVDEKAEAAKREREALQQEIDAVKKEYEEKLKKKGSKKKDDKKKNEIEETEKERDDKIKSLEAKAEIKPDDGPKTFNLHKYERNFYQMRIDRLRKAELAKRNQERMRDPSFFPKAPMGDLSST